MNERRSRTLASRNELCGPSSCTPEHAAALLKSNSGTTMNFSACFYERQDVIFGMNAISHVPEPYLDPVLLIGGRRVARTPFKRSSYKIVTDQQKNTLPNLVLRVEEDMEDTNTLGDLKRPVPKPRVRKTVSDCDTLVPTATLPSGTTLPSEDPHVNSQTNSAAQRHPAAPGIPPPVQKRTHSSSTLGGDPCAHRSLASTGANTTTIQATPYGGSGNYEVPVDKKMRPKPPRPPPPRPALIQKYTKQGDKQPSSGDKKSVPSPSTKGKTEGRNPAGKQPKAPLTRAQSVATPTGTERGDDDRGGVHDYEDLDKFLPPQRGAFPAPGEKGKASPGVEADSPTPPQQRGGGDGAIPALPPRTIPVKKSKLSILAALSNQQPDKPTPYSAAPQDTGEYSEVKDEDYTDMHPVIDQPGTKPKEEIVDVYVGIHRKSSVGDYVFMEDDQAGSLYASSDLLANRPDLKL